MEGKGQRITYCFSSEFSSDSMTERTSSFLANFCHCHGFYSFLLSLYNSFSAFFKLCLNYCGFSEFQKSNASSLDLGTHQQSQHLYFRLRCGCCQHLASAPSSVYCRGWHMSSGSCPSLWEDGWSFSPFVSRALYQWCLAPSILGGHSLNQKRVTLLTSLKSFFSSGKATIGSTEGHGSTNLPSPMKIWSLRLSLAMEVWQQQLDWLRYHWIGPRNFHHLGNKHSNTWTYGEASKLKSQ